MKTRCLVRSSKSFHNYGGRGIQIYPEWAAYGTGFAAFRDWIEANLGLKPEGHSLDRIDNDGNYEPGNLRWASREEQSKNRRPWTKRTVCKNPKHGYRWVKRSGNRWMGSFTSGGVIQYVGCFTTKKEAYEASRAKRIEMGLPVD